MMKYLPFYLSSLMVLAHIYMTEYYERPFFYIWLNLSLLPFIDQVLPKGTSNPTSEEAKIMNKQTRWNIPLYSYFFLEWVALFWTLNYANRAGVTSLEAFLLAIDMGIISSVGFVFAHEFMHRREFFDRTLGVLDMLKSLYLHFYSEHTLGHHKHVATPKDPTTAPLNQNLYAFLANTLYQSFANSWNREIRILKKNGYSTWTIHNRMIQWVTLEFIFTLGIWAFWGTLGLIVFLFQALLSVLFLESISYIRHYGLLRKKLENGKYEPVDTKHSWNASDILQNYLYLNLQRHSDHHAYAYKPYQVLLNHKDSANLPCGYNVSVFVALFPPIWFKMINPLVANTNEHGKPEPSQLEVSKLTVKQYLTCQISLFTILALFVS